MATTFNNLPLLDLSKHIFKYLEIADLIQLRRVSKLFKEVIDRLVFNEIIVNEEVSNIGWLHTNELVNLKEANIIDDWKKFVISVPIFQLEKNLKKLIINEFDKQWIADNINNFTLLEHLELIGFGKKLKQINLPNLQALNFFNYIDSYSITLNCPKLKAVKLFHGADCKIINPSSIEYVYLTDFDEEFICQFPNLKHAIFEVHNMMFFDIHPAVFKLKKLKTISVYDDGHMIDEELEKVLKRKSKARADLKFYFNHVELVDLKKLDEYISSGDRFKFQLDNYDLLDNEFIFRCYVDYKYLIKKWPKFEQIPSSFFSKFAIRTSFHSVAKITNHQHFLQVLSKFQRLFYLTLIEPGLNQLTYDQLPNVLDGINCMYIKEKGKHKIENLDFLTKFNSLEQVEVEVNSNSDTIVVVLKLFKKINNLRSLKLKYKEHLIDIYRYGPEKYRCTFGRTGHCGNDVINYNQFVQYCENFRKQY